jgi:nicotinamide mononucleotide adenylyltransferase
MRISDIITEGIAKQVTVFYGGRFQPMHKGHHTLYEKLVNKFGADNVFIATTFAAKQQAMHTANDYSTDPFTLEEKASIMSKMFGIPLNRIVNTLPYQPDVSLVGRDKSNTATVLAYSDKDKGRFKPGNVMAPLPDDLNNLQTEDENRVYYIAMPVDEGGMSATKFREVMSSDATFEDKQKKFVGFFGKFDQEIFDFIEGRVR